MLRTFRPVFALFLLLAASTGADAADPVPRINCLLPGDVDEDMSPSEPEPFEVLSSGAAPAATTAAKTTPAKAGPLTPSAIYCQRIEKNSLGSVPAISPDGQSIAYYKGGKELRIARLKQDIWTTYPVDLGTFARFASAHDGEPPFA